MYLNTAEFNKTESPGDTGSFVFDEPDIRHTQITYILHRCFHLMQKKTHT